MKYYGKATVICLFIFGVSLGVELYNMGLGKIRPSPPTTYTTSKSEIIESFHPTTSLPKTKDESKHPQFDMKSQIDTRNQDVITQSPPTILYSETRQNESQRTHHKLQIDKCTITDTISYDSYNRYGLEWMGQVTELEWTESHSPHSTGTRQRRTLVNFDVGKGSLGLTSSDNTKFKLYGQKNTIQKGSLVHVVIETYDIYSNAKRRGGDFFSAVMSNDKLQKSTSGRVLDYGNGTYSVFFYAAWAGDAEIHLALILTREAIDFVQNVIRERKLLNFGVTYFDGKRRENSSCKLVNGGQWKDKCSYTNQNSIGSTAIVCNKPGMLGCDKLYDVTTGVRQLNEDMQDEIKDVKYLYDGKYHQTKLAGSPMKVKITDSTLPPPTLPVCGPDLPIPISDGYWENNVTFIPMVCQSQQWTQEEAQKCLSNKVFKIYGDSTLNQVQNALYGTIKDRSRIDYHYIAPRMGGEPRLVQVMLMESDYLDTLSQDECVSKQFIVILNFSFHLGLWSNKAYLERIFHARGAVERLMRRCHGNVLIFIKMAHPRDNLYAEQTVHSNNWTFYTMNRMIRHVFGDMHVHFWEVWDMVQSHPSPNQVHMPTEVIGQQLQLFFSYICPEMGRTN